MVVDQSDDTRTRAIADSFAAFLPNLNYRHSHLKGKCRACNIGIDATEGDIVAFLDHDCTVQPDWLVQVANTFERHPGAALVFGSLVAPPGRTGFASDGWIPEGIVKVEREANVADSTHDHAIIPLLIGYGACMYVRRDAIQRIGPFDVHFGPGARFGGSEDADYAYRILMKGYSIARTPTIVIEHHGFRDYESGAASRHIRDYAYSNGAWQMKALRSRDIFALLWIASQTPVYLHFVNMHNLIHGRGPTGLAHIVMYIRGLIDSFQLGVDLRLSLYVARSARWLR